MRSSAKLLPGLAFALLSSFATAQGNLGELLDAGARRLVKDEFKEQIAQRTIIGATPTGTTLEIMYAINGSIAGGLAPGPTYRPGWVVSGDWKIDNDERICTAMQIVPTYGAPTVLAPRCQFWFKLGESYYVSDSDTDRRASVLRRTVKSSIAATPGNLGELLDAGAKRLTADQFKREVLQRVIVGPTPSGGMLELMYAGNGVIQGRGSASMDYRGSPVSGEWTIDENDKICTTMRLDPRTGTVIPKSCQVWFKLGTDFFISDSESDRRAKVLRRTVKSSIAATPGNLGELLDAGAKRLSAEQFRTEVVQRPLVGPTDAGGNMELMYVANGSIQGAGSAGYHTPVNVPTSQVRGEWTIDKEERICTTMQITAGSYGTIVIAPSRCQTWFKLGDAYYISDSESDRHAKLVRRTIKP